MKILDLYSKVKARLKAGSISESEIEAELLLEYVFNKTRVQLFLSGDEGVPEKKIQYLDELVTRRLKREPLAYILGEKEFWSLPFRVTPDVLIPRPETEQLLELIIQTCKEEHKFCEGSILDLGVGSGIISIVLALELTYSEVIAIDRSVEALKVAAYNAKQHGVEKKVQFVCADWLSALQRGQRFGLVVSNPPYVASEDFSLLQPELDFEPRWALDGGKQGFREIERIIPSLSEILIPGGWFFMEIGEKQGDYLVDRFAAMPEYDEIKVHKDYAGLPRIFQARSKPS